MNPVQAVDLEKNSNKDPKLLLVLKQSLELQRLVAAWPSLPKDVEELFNTTLEAPEDRQERWEWLWSLVKYDRRQWLELALLADNSFNRSLIDRLIMFKMVFPDGSLQEWVERFATFVAVGMFAAKGKKGKPPMEDEKPKEGEKEPPKVSIAGKDADA